MADTHLFTTKNPIMNDLGLGSFTTGILYDWVTEQNGANLINITPDYWDLFSIDEPNDPLAAMRHILTNNVPTDMSQFYIETKRPKGRTFENITYTGLTSNKSYDSNWRYKVKVIDYSFNYLKISDFSSSAGKYTDKITSIIKLNDWVNDKGHMSDPLYQARATFVRDIRRSDHEGIIWTNYVDIRLPGFDQICTIPVKWKLLLYKKKPLATHTLATKNPSFAISQQNSLGVKHGARDVTGRLVGNEEIAGELDVWTDPASGKVRAGNKLVMAVMTSDLPKADAPDDETPEGARNTTTGRSVKFGTARPIMMKDGNPLDWGPEYKYKNACGLSDDEKNELYEIPVINAYSTVSFAKGEEVMLADNGGGGVWQVLKVFDITSGPQPIVPSVDNWSITSMASNAEHYFKSSNRSLTNPITFDEYEKGIYNEYYDLEDNPYLDHIKHDQNGYVQITSFDMMGKNVGGTRDTHALGNTQIGTRANGQPMEDLTDVLGITTTPFFGCVFPDGYEGGAKYTEYRESSTVKMVASNPDKGSQGRKNLVYVNDIPTGTKIFDSDAGHSNTAGSPFQDGSPSLLQLPADIALHASPNSDGIGSPITLVDSLYWWFKPIPPDPTIPPGFNMQRNTRLWSEDSKRYAWLQREDGGDTFGFTPKNKGRIQFRPLKAEIYAAFEISKGGSPTKITDDSVRGCWANRGYLKTGYTGSPISDKVWQRQTIFKKPGESTGIIGPSGFKYNLDIETYLPSENSAFPKPYFRLGGPNGWQKYDRPAGGVGIIGAQVTVTAGTAISFQVKENYFGMDDWFFNNPAGGDWSSSFGDKPTDYNRLNNTSLHARVFQHWPKKQTVYDPRFFAVFHFGEGLGGDNRFPSVKYMASYKIEGKMTVTEITGGPDNTPSAEQNWLDLKDVDSFGGFSGMSNRVPIGYSPTGSESGKWKVEELSFPKADIRVPTLIKDTGSHPNTGMGTIAIPTGDKQNSCDTCPYQIWGAQDVNNVPLSGVWNDSSISGWRNPEDWQLDVYFRGRLLPATNKVKVIGIESITSPDGFTYDDQVVIHSRGAGYSDEDTFTTKGGSGQNVILKANTGTNGVIENFTIIESGGGFIPADFFAPTDKPSYQAAKVTVEPLNITSDGDGLQAYIKYGLIITQKITLTGPQEATDENIFDLVNEPPVPTELNGSIRKAISSPSTTNAIITKPSPTNQYDVFLHYHNDISHVFDERWNVGGGGPRAMEQFINLEIIPDGSASTTVIANDGSTANTRNQGSSSSTLSDATSLSNQLRPDTGLTYGS